MSERTSTFWQCFANFYPEAEELRKYFDQQFNDPRDLHENRFVWDYWHIPEQYSLLRTPAYNYFPESIYNPFEQHLIQWGQKTLGCSSISTPWLSCYIDGCFQGIHADNIHGPWAFVFSLTAPGESKNFEGGCTQLLQPSVLNYWQSHDLAQGLEGDQLIKKIESPFNQLTLFDPRIPHGVDEVRGSRDPRQGRLVIHGWFTEPQPYIEGALEPEVAGPKLDEQLDNVYSQLDTMGAYSGVMSLRLLVGADGQTKSVIALTNTLIPLDRDSLLGSDVEQKVIEEIEKFRFSESNGETSITLPFVFQ